jgi:hypothetical protein
MFKNFGVTYRAILFIIAIVFLFVYGFMFIFHIGGSAFSYIKFGFFTHRTIYIVTDLPADDNVLMFSVDYISKQSLKKYKHKVVNFEECKKQKNCINKFGIAVSREPNFVYNFIKKGLLKPDDNIVNIIKQNGGSVDKGVIILRNNNNKNYYYAVGEHAPFGSLLISMPVSIMNIM